MTKIDHTVIYADMPCTIKGFTRLTDDYYTIVLNSRLSLEEQKETYRHELDHLQDGDFYSERDADSIERSHI